MSIKNHADLGANAWIVDEMYREYVENPSSVSESWREFFVDYRPGSGAIATTNAASPTHAAATPAHAALGSDAHLNPITTSPNGAKSDVEDRSGASSASKATPAPSAGTPAHVAPSPMPEGSQPLRGVAAKIVENMELSLDVPTATSFRDVPARLLEVNRKIVNGHLGRTRGGKISFTHIIGYAIVRAIADSMPAMNNGFFEGEDGKPNIVRRPNVGLGIAIDIEKSRSSE